MNTTRIPIEKKESVRWLENVRQSTELLGDTKRCVHLGDRESDIYELFGVCESLGTQFVFRTCVDRRSGDGEQTVAKTMQRQPIKAVHRVEVLDAKSKPSTAVLELKYHRLPVLSAYRKEKRYAGTTFTVIHATERGKPKDREPIEWCPFRGLRGPQGRLFCFLRAAGLLAGWRQGGRKCGEIAAPGVGKETRELSRRRRGKLRQEAGEVVLRIELVALGAGDE